ncbi:PQQ-binding-like beta-propeller repeat protein [bacterium]|nr:PQQ-binding-like beta-propeller repeat protein [bacterium]
MAVRKLTVLSVLVAGTLSVDAAGAADWARFRGPNGSGVSADEAPIPAEWSDSKNLQWKAELPGPGASSPIVVGDRVFVTSWSGYADGSDGGSLDSLERHLVCLDRKTGKQLWMSSVAAKLPEESYRGMFAENGYASHTPVSDGGIVVAFFGKSGVYAYDLEGKELWNADAGEALDQRGWGSASSPILYQDKVIVTASIESHSVIAFDTKTGKKIWKQEADGFGSTWGTPVVVGSGDDAELVIGVPYEVWALNPENGKLKWYCEAMASSSMCSSVVAQNGVIYGVESGPGGGGSIAIKAGGKGDISKSATLWTGGDRSRIDTPVVYDGLLYYVSNGVVSCLDAKTGDRVYQGRLSDGAAGGREGGDRPERGRGGFGGGRGGFGGGRGGGQDYSSPIIADGKLIFARRSGDVFVVKTGRKFEQLAVNRFDSSAGDFNATPAVSDGQLFIRSSKTLYCVSATK